MNFRLQLTGPALVCAIVFAVLVLAGLMTLLVIRLCGLAKTLRYINLEIARTEGTERQYWKEKKRKCWLSLIPFYNPKQ